MPFVERQFIIMNVIENRLIGILSGYDDIALEIIQICEDFCGNKKVALNAELQNELMIRLSTNKLEEEVWDKLLSILSPDDLEERVLNYLIQNNISLLTLCHMQLQDKWLLKLIAYDDAPLYTLAKRYYLSDKYSPHEFLQFYNQYLYSIHDITLYLLDLFVNADKRGLLIFLCSNNKEFEYKERLQWHKVADQVKGLTDSNAIASVYKEYPNVGTILNEIANNYFTSEEILLELSSIKGINSAREIRKNSLNTLAMKQIAEQKV